MPNYSRKIKKELEQIEREIKKNYSFIEIEQSYNKHLKTNLKNTLNDKAAVVVTASSPKCLHAQLFYTKQNFKRALATIL
jgi:vacuolar-type H+-ATPase subunit F/Vma7